MSLSCCLTYETDKTPFLYDDSCGAVRADHPMWPQQSGVYYFEVTIEECSGHGYVACSSNPFPVPYGIRLTVTSSSSRRAAFGIGFCEEHTSLGMHLGWTEGAWGYHGDDGNIYNKGGTGTAWGPRYEVGDTVGCGVNFDKGIAFYTRNGKVLGEQIS